MPFIKGKVFNRLNPKSETTPYYEFQRKENRLRRRWSHGANMARNLTDKGYSISCVNDVNQEAAASFANELGCAHASTLAEVTAQSDIVLTVVTNDAAMESIFFGTDDNLFQDASGTFSLIVPPYPLPCM